MLNRFKPWLGLSVIVLTTVALLRAQGRLWWCACGTPAIWISDAWGAHTSQHLFDPYSLSHVVHGILFGGLAWIVARKRPFAWQLCLAVAIECFWEVVENSGPVIHRFRAATAAVGYEGDSIANSLGDILCAAVGVVLARRLGLWLSVALAVTIELVLLFWIRDGLLVSLVMLAHPNEAMRVWQAGHS